MANVIRKRKQRKKTAVISELSSSDEDDVASCASSTPACHSLQQNTSRSSERLQKKRCKVFHMPSREDVWNKISPGKSPGKYDHLMPRRLVNDFTKENNRYNYDPNETSGDESLDDFLDDSLSELSSSSVEDESRSKSKRQIKGRHQRLVVRTGSETSDSTDVEASKENSSPEKEEGVFSGDSAICVKTKNLENKDIKRLQKGVGICQAELNEESKTNNGTVSNNDEESDEEEMFKVKTRKHNRSVLESDEDNESEDKERQKKQNNNRNCGKEIEVKKDNSKNVLEVDNDESDEEVVVKGKRNRSIIESDEDISDSKNSPVIQEQDASSAENGNGKVKAGNNLKSECKSENKNKSGSSANIDRHEVSTSTADNLGQTSTCSHIDNVDEEDFSVNQISESSDLESDSDDTSSGSDEVSDDDETLNCSSRVRVQMLKKKQKRKDLFEKFRKERERKLSKEHK